MQWKVRLDVVAVATAVLLLHHVARFRQVDDNPVGGALGDVERRCEVPKARVRIVGDEHQRARVVRQEAPVTHVDNGRPILEVIC